MKNFFKNALGVGVVFCTLLVIASCGKNNAPGGGVDPKPATLSVTFGTAPKVFYGQKSEVTYTVANAPTGSKVVINGEEKALSGSYTVPAVNGTASVSLSVFDGKGTVLLSTSTTLNSYTADETRLAYVPAWRTGKWQWESGRLFYSGSWHLEASICEPTRFFVETKKSTMYATQCGGSMDYWNNDWFIKDGSLLWDGNTYSVTFPNDSTLIRTIVNLSGQTVEETFRMH